MKEDGKVVGVVLCALIILVGFVVAGPTNAGNNTNASVAGIRDDSDRSSNREIDEMFDPGTSTLAQVMIDVEAPEAVVDFDPDTKNIVVRGVDNFDEDVHVTAEIMDMKPHLALMRYTLADDAGNTLEMTLELKDRNENRKAVVLGLRYNNNPLIVPANNFYGVEFKTDKHSGELKHVHQNIHVVEGTEIRARYEAMSQETRIDYREEGEHKSITEVAGLVIFGLRTDSGELSIIPIRPDTARDATGNLHMVYQDRREAGNFEIYYTNDIGIVGHGWNSPMRLSNTSADSVWPEIGIDSMSGLIFVTWIEQTPDRDAKYYTISRDHGGSWQDPNTMFTKILLKADVFDPIKEEPDIPRELTAHKEEGYYIVQFATPTFQEWKDGIEMLGGEFHGYIPSNAFVVGMSEDVRMQVEELPYVTWIGIYQPAYKISHELLAYATEGGANSDVSIDISVFANVDVVASEIQDLDGEIKENYATSLRVNIKSKRIRDAAFLPDVSWIQKTPKYRLFNDLAVGIMNVPATWTTHGLTGTGQVVAVADTGLDTGFIANFDDDGDGLIDEDPVDGVDNDADGLVDEDDKNHDDFEGRIANIYAWGDGSAADINSGHGTHVAGSVLGDGSRSGGSIKGVAHDARLVFQALEDDATGMGWVPLDLNVLFQEAYIDPSNPRIHTNSWGVDCCGNYDGSARNVDEFVWDNKDMVILFAVGNDGMDVDSDGEVDLDSISSPATAKNSISVGASENWRPAFNAFTYGGSWPADYPANPIFGDSMGDDHEGSAAFSGRGPTLDKRVRPDVVAPGTWILSTRSSQTAQNLWRTFDNFYTYSGGTSMATPLTAGAAALVRQYYVDFKSIAPSAALVKATLINGATDMLGQYTTGGDGDGNGAAEPIPNEHEGWGRVNLTNSIFPPSPRLLRSEDISPGFSTGSGGPSDVYTYGVAAGEPLRITLVWTDAPGTTTAGLALVNNLDLRVTAPDGTVYRGNVFANGESDVGGSFDTRNNTENVYINNPQQGTFTIEVMPTNTNDGPQPYSLVVSYAPLGARILLCTTWGSAAEGVKDNLDAELGAFDAIIDTREWGPNGENSPPPLSLMMQYEVVVVGTWDIPSPSLADAMGDALADYTDMGGNVVQMYGSFDTSDRITGRWTDEGYNTIVLGPPHLGWESLDEVFFPVHPIYTGVSALSAYYKHDSTTVTAGATILADYTSRKILVAATGDGHHTPGGGRIVGLNYFPRASDCTGDYMTLMANSVRWSSQVPYWP